jgi:MYXO-CTERM domain-containing protein
MAKLAALALLSGTLLATTTARADQCGYVTEAQAEDALALVEAGAHLVEYCEPCGEQPVSVSVETIAAAPAGFESYWEVKVNDTGIDLAYVFVENGDGNWVNLAHMVDCPVDGVSCVLDPSFAPLEACPSDDNDDKEDGLGGEGSGGCQVGASGGGGAGWMILGLVGIALVSRRRRG